MIEGTESSLNGKTNDSVLHNPSRNAATAASDFQSFLTLLTAQLRNQDPLSPLDSTQFLQQLASFSAVEQQIETNALLEKLSSDIVKSGLERATPWIGKEVETVSGVAHFDGRPLKYRVPDGVTKDGAEIVVIDAHDAVVYRQALSGGTSTFVWDGKTSNGASAAAGDYLVSIKTIGDGEVIETTSPIAITNVVEARLEESSIRLVLSNGAVIDPTSVLAVRASIDQSEEPSS